MQTPIEMDHIATDPDHLLKCDPCWAIAVKDFRGEGVEETYYEREAEKDRPSAEEEMAMALAAPCAYCGAESGEECAPDCLGEVN